MNLSKYMVRRYGAMCFEHSKIAWWELLEAHPEESGMWRMTQDGFAFAENRKKILSHAVEYRSELLELTGDMISVVDALGRKFNYQELMRESLIGRAG
mgnify:CR=1 FL=1